MQTMKKYWEDAFVFSFEGNVKEVIRQADRIGVILDGSYFYPEGGGQPCDRGMIDYLPVLDVQEVEEKIVHYLAASEESLKKFSTGKMVACEIDQDYRINNMRLHTTCHILYGAAHKLFGDVGYAGFNIGDVGNLYLETPRLIRSEDLREISSLANEVVVADRQVTSSFVSADQAKSMKELAYNLELPSGQVRIIEVAGWDIAACSGTHMRRTVELGPVKVIAREIHKKNVTRIDYAVGKRAVEEMAREDKILSETAEFLNTSKDQVPALLRKLSSENQGMQKDLRQLRERLMDQRVKELQQGGAEKINDVSLICDYVDYLDANGLKTMATKLLNGISRVVVVLIAGTDILSVAAGCSSDLNLMISQPVVAVAKKYGGGGGGKPSFVSAGGIQARSDILMADLREQISQTILSR